MLCSAALLSEVLNKEDSFQMMFKNVYGKAPDSQLSGSRQWGQTE